MFGKSVNISNKEQLYIVNRLCIDKDFDKKVKKFTKGQAKVMQKIFKQLEEGEGNCSVNKKDLSSLVEKIRVRGEIAKSKPSWLKGALTKILTAIFGKNKLSQKQQDNILDALKKHEKTESVEKEIKILKKLSDTVIEKRKEKTKEDVESITSTIQSSQGDSRIADEDL